MVADPHGQKQAQKHHCQNEQLGRIAELPLQNGCNAEFQLAAREGRGNGVPSQQKQRGVVEDVSHAKVCSGLHFHGETGILGVLQYA